MESALIRANATRAHNAWCDAVELSLSNKTDYQNYITNGPMPSNKYYESMTALSLKYLTSGEQILNLKTEELNLIIKKVNSWLSSKNKA